VRLLRSIAGWVGSWLANTLSWWQWLILAAVPPAIVALYFLKLKRRPLEVPSTYLWHKSVEDLHVNSIWQRLRRNLLLLLQLLLIFLVMLALLRPSWQGRKLSGERFIFLVDNSASMQATDVAPNRLEEAKRRAGELIDQMDSGDVAMIVSFADTARVEQTFTDDRRRLRRSLEAIGPTQRSTSLLEALRVASGLANPGRSAEADNVSDVQVAEALPAELFILSDGKFGPVTGFSLGNLKPTFVPIGLPGAANVGIEAFSVGHSQDGRDQLQAFARLENFGTEKATVLIELFLDGPLHGADRCQIAGGQTHAVAFPLGEVESGVLRLRATTGDHLAVDDEAFAVISPPRRAKVLLVTPGVEPLALALQTKSAAELAEVQIESPDFLKTKPYQELSAGGAYDLVIYDRCRPQRMPPNNTLLIGSVPPEGGWSAADKRALPQIIDLQAAHPLLQWIDLGDVVLSEGTPLAVPPGGSVLIDSDVGPMAAIAPREAFEDVVLGFVLMGEAADAAGKREKYIGTNWPIRPSFPVFVLNVLDYLAGARRSLEAESVQPGKPVSLEGLPSQSGLRVRTPSGRTVELPAGKSGKVTFTETSEVGVYEVQAAGKSLRRLAVNLFDPVESDIRPGSEPALKIGYVDVPGRTDWEAARREIWKVLVLIGLGVLLLEWYTYRRRVQL
jgi:hypothetical protein